MGQRKNKTFPERCNEVYEFFVGYYSKNHVAPSYNDMTEGTGILRGNLAIVIKQLIRENRLERKPNTSRGLWPVQSTIQSSLPLHLAGQIAANSPNPLIVLDQYDKDTTLEVPGYLLPTGATSSKFYVLQVKGDSMSRANILNGDYVVMQAGNAYRDDDIVAIWLKDENAATLKMLKQTERGNAKLQPKSHKPRHQPRIENMGGIEVQGRVVAIMRKC